MGIAENCPAVCDEPVLGVMICEPSPSFGPPSLTCALGCDRFHYVAYDAMEEEAPLPDAFLVTCRITLPVVGDGTTYPYAYVTFGDEPTCPAGGSDPDADPQPLFVRDGPPTTTSPYTYPVLIGQCALVWEVTVYGNTYGSDGSTLFPCALPAT